MTGLLLAAVVIGAIGIIIGVLLGIASEKFKVEVDEKEILVRAELPGNNCGGCGFPGCDGLAAAIATLIFLLVGALAIVNLKATRMKFD
jgi:electron transport complex protein RnfB